MLSISLEMAQDKRFIDLFIWARDELINGNRIKASRISKVAERYRRKGQCYLIAPLPPPKNYKGCDKVDN